MDWTLVAVPPAVGAIIAVILELLKRYGNLPDDQGGRVAMGLSIVASFVLTFGVNLGVFNEDGASYNALMELLGLIAQIAMIFLGSLGSHKALKTSKLSAR